MTTIATDGRTIAADGLMTLGGERVRRPHQKLLSSEGGRIIGVSGIMGMLGHLATWYDCGCDHAKVPPLPANTSGWGMIIVETDGRVLYVCDTALYPVEVGLPFAIGSGGEVAMGAMMAGASPQRAVEIAIEVKICSGGPVQVLDIARVHDARAQTGVAMAAE